MAETFTYNEIKNATEGIRVTIHLKDENKVSNGINTSFVIHCGAGLQSIKWLALAATQRYSLMGKPKGRSRTREDLGSRMGTFLPSRVVVNGQEIEPHLLVKNTLKNDDQVQVNLMSEASMDEYGTPIFTEWSKKAFVHSEYQKNRNDVLDKIKGEKSKKDKEEAIVDTSSSRRFSVEMKVIMTGHIDSKEEVAVALSFDWKAMKIIKIVSQIQERGEIYNCLESKYKMLNEIYISICGLPRLGETLGVNLVEFAHLLHASGAADCNIVPTQIKEIFKAAVNKETVMSRSLFVEGIIRAAVLFYLKGCDGVHPPGKQQHSPKSESDAVIACIGDIEALYEKKKQNKFYQMYNDKIDALIDFNRFHLKRLYVKYTQPAPEGGLGVSLYDNAIPLTMFREIVKEISIIPTSIETAQRDIMDENKPTKEEELLADALMQVQSIFVNAQLRELTFAEFLEGICRISILCMTGEFSDQEKAQMGIASLIDISMNYMS